jgi:hypothetical protein
MVTQKEFYKNLVQSEIWGLLGYYAALVWQLFTDVSGQSISPIRTGSDGTDTLSRNVGKQLPHERRVTPQKTADFINIAAEAWNQD